jgi:hypothetical protein
MIYPQFGKIFKVAKHFIKRDGEDVELLERDFEPEADLELFERDFEPESELDMLD